ncbi:DUF4177 domain-containing protein [Pontimicrobium sp. IMCC45349]|uniref:DUF4177 domain-containing protein n=1 Tax=Pontimicrobium sp. IMCC45349 TaxID=3391574 RepID=UPI00399F4FA9
MKEYKVETPSLGFRNRAKKLEEFLNNTAREGWALKETVLGEGGYVVIFERDKNR